MSTRRDELRRRIEAGEEVTLADLIQVLEAERAALPRAPGAVDSPAAPSWERLRARIEEGDRVTASEILDAIRLEGVPADLGPFVADRLSARAAARAGRPPETRVQKEWRWYRVRVLQHTVAALQLTARLRGERLTKEKAIARLAKQMKLSQSTLRNLLRYGVADAPAVSESELDELSIPVTFSADALAHWPGIAPGGHGEARLRLFRDARPPKKPPTG